MNLSDREQKIVLATIRLYNVNKNKGFVPDFELRDMGLNLTDEDKREIRDLVQHTRRINEA